MPGISKVPVTLWVLESTTVTSGDGAPVRKILSEFGSKKTKFGGYE